jgi:hypothetical protein
MRLHAAVMVCTEDASPITILTLSEEEALHAQKIIRDGRELLVISEMDLYQRENGTIAGLLRTKKRQCRKSESILRQMKHHRVCRLVNALLETTSFIIF